MEVDRNHLTRPRYVYIRAVPITKACGWLGGADDCVGTLCYPQIAAVYVGREDSVLQKPPPFPV